MLAYALPALYTLFVWWFSTGSILYLDQRPRKTHARSLAMASIVLAAALWGLTATRNDASEFGAYAAFTCSVAVWGWQEMAFLMGFIRGPRTTPCPVEYTGWKRFIAAAQTVIYHELALVVSLVVVMLLTLHGTNQTALWTFLVLWAMRLSAKLNLFLGVRNRSEGLLPEHLRYLQTFFKHKQVNYFFPISVTVASIVAALGWSEVFSSLPHDAASTRLNFVCALLSLAILEHWFMVLPIDPTALWNWHSKREGRGSEAKMQTVATTSPASIPAVKKTAATQAA